MMRGGHDSWARVQRLDVDRVLALLAEQDGPRLTPDGPCPGGEVGAAYVLWPDGHRSILKWRPGTTRAGMTAGPLLVAETLRRAGYPAPRTEFVTDLAGATVFVQEVLPGRTLDRVDHPTLDQLLALNAEQRGALTGHGSVPPTELYLGTDGSGYCLHDPLRQHSRRTAELERRIVAVGQRYGEALPGDDAVHHDFHPANVLADRGVITGVIDWDGAGRGDCRFDLVTLRFGMHVVPCAADVIARLDEHLDRIPAGILYPAWAHMSLRMVDWAIRHFTDDDVEHWLNLAELRLPRTIGR